MSQPKKPTEAKKRNARGQFVKGNKIGEETRFQKENAASCKYKEAVSYTHLTLPTNSLV